MTESTSPRPSPRRRLLRPRNVLLAAGVLVLLWVGRQVYWLATAEPAPVVDYAVRMEALAAAHQPEGTNGWSLFLDASTRLDEIEVEVTEAILVPEEVRPSDRYAAPDYALMRADPVDRAFFAPELRALALMRESGSVNDLLARAAASPRAVRPLVSNPPIFMNLMLPELARFRNLAKARVAGMRMAGLDGDQAERVAALEQSLALARACASQTTLIDRLVGLAIAAMTLEELRAGLIDHPPDAATCRAMLDAIDRQIGAIPPMSMAIEAERLAMFDFVQWAFSDDGHGDGRLDFSKFSNAMNAWGGPSPPGNGLLGRVGSLFLAGRRETTDLANELYDGLAADTELDVVTRMESGFDEGAFHARLGYRHMFLGMILPALSKALNQQDRVMADLEATRLLLAIEIFRAEQGRLPASLDELPPTILPALPADPMHGGAFRYRILAEPDEHGRDYYLYSTGLDQTDDAFGEAASGEAPEDPESMFHVGRDHMTNGLDVLYNNPRKEREDEEY